MIGFESPQQLRITLSVCLAISLISAIAAQRDRRRIQEILDALDGATAAPLARAVPTVPGGRDRTLERLVALGLIRESIPGHYYKVEPAWQALAVRMRRRGVLIAAALVAIPLIMLWLFA